MSNILLERESSIALAQLNFRVGDFSYNSKKILENIFIAEKNNVELLLFPELSIIGSSIDCVVKRHPILVQENQKWLKEIAKFVTKTNVVIGYLGFVDGILTKSLAIVADKTVKKIVNDIDEVKIVEINGVKYLLVFDSNDIDCKDDFDVILDFESFISRTNSEYYRNLMLSELAKRTKKPLVNISRVGAIDGYSYDGSSRLYDENGDIIARASSYKEELYIFNSKQNNSISTLPLGVEEKPKESFSLDYECDLERTYLSLVQIVRDYFQKNGFERAVLGLSGGLDSTVAAVILVDALGKENVYGISMPSKITSSESRTDAEQLAFNLGMHFSEVSIKTIYDEYSKIFSHMFGEIQQKWDYRYSKSFTNDNIQARARAMYLWGVSNEFAKCTPIATSDKSESYMGYATINGDMSGGFAPLADITKTKLFALARWLNKNRTEQNAIPESIILKRPGAELAIDEKTGKPLCAEDALMPYEFMDEVIWRIENKGESYQDMLSSKFVYEENNELSLDDKKSWLDKFFRRMSTSAYKWSILPPSAIIDTYSISKNEYSLPISSAGVNYKTLEQQEIIDILNAVIL